MDFEIEVEQEEDGRWIADIPELLSIMVYGDLHKEAWWQPATA